MATSPGELLMATAGLIAVGTLSPGPANLVMMREAARGGWRVAVSAGAGILTGNLAVVVAAVAGADRFVAREPGVMRAASVAGAGLLILFGLAMMRGEARGRAARDPSAMRRFGTAAGLFLFQLLNPKAWLVVITSVASIAVSADLSGYLPHLLALFLVIPAVGLTLWSCLGFIVADRLDRAAGAGWLDRLTGALLAGSALVMLVGALDVS